MVRRLALTLVLPLALVLAVPGLAAGLQRTGDASVAFHGKGPAGFRVDGKTGELKVEDVGSAVRLSVPLDTLDTGIALRDEHMRRDYLETGKYPTALLEVPWSELKLPQQDGQQSQGSARGKLTLHGQTRDAKVSYRISQVAGIYQVTATLPVSLKDYGIKVPSYMGLTLEPDITTHVAFSARRT